MDIQTYIHNHNKRKGDIIMNGFSNKDTLIKGGFPPTNANPQKQENNGGENNQAPQQSAKKSRKLMIKGKCYKM